MDTQREGSSEQKQGRGHRIRFLFLCNEITTNLVLANISLYLTVSVDQEPGHSLAEPLA